MMTQSIPRGTRAELALGLAQADLKRAHATLEYARKWHSMVSVSTIKAAEGNYLLALDVLWDRQREVEAEDAWIKENCAIAA